MWEMISDRAWSWRRCRSFNRAAAFSSALRACFTPWIDIKLPDSSHDGFEV